MDLNKLKREGVPITMLTAHDYPSARFIESASAVAADVDVARLSPEDRKALNFRRGVDICLVGDSLAMVALGYASTTSLSLDEMLYHCRAVARGCATSLLVADLPFGTFGASVEQGVRSAMRLIQEGNMDAVKIEGGREIAPLVKALAALGIPVMGHGGLTPQRQAALSGFRVQGKSAASAQRVVDDLLALEDAGAFALLVEAVPVPLGAYIARRAKVPTIGIGAGPGTSGQVLVQLDMMGVNSLHGAGPKFLKRYGRMEEMAVGAIREYVGEVREGAFPEAVRHGYPVAEDEWAKIEAALDGQK